MSGSATVAAPWVPYPCPTPGCRRKLLFRARGVAEVEIKCESCKQVVTVAVR